VDERLGADDCKNLKDRREPAIKLDKEPAIAVCESNTATQLAPQNNQLMSKRRVLSFRPQLRLGEARTAKAKQSSPIISPV
jgi:hypothetical protein